MIAAISNNINKNCSPKPKIGFGRNPANIEDIITEVITKDKKMPLIAKFGYKVRNIVTNENYKVIINAAGTAGIAPLVIIYNPLSKKDKDSRKYAALRQFPSAACAILIGAFSGGMAGVFIKKAAALGKLGKALDTRVTDSVAKKIATRKATTLGEVLGMLIGMLIIPIQAKILNLIYPPFVEKVAPNLVSRIKEKDAQKNDDKSRSSKQNFIKYESLEGWLKS